MKASRIAMLLIGLVVAFAVVVAGCGDSDSDSTGTDTGASTESNGGEASGTGFQEATEEAEKWETVRTGPEIPKLKEPAPKGLKVAVVGCALPSCQPTTEGAVKASEELGYDVNYVVYESTPEGYQQTLAEIAREEPDIMTFISGFPDEIVEDSLKSMADSGTAVVQITPQAGEEPNEIVKAVQQGPPFWEQAGLLAALGMLADAGEPFDSAVIRDPSFGVFAPSQEKYEATIAQYCPECKVDSIAVSLLAPGPEQLSQVTNYLRQNPDTEYLFYTNGGQAAGLPEALEAAGRSDVKFIAQPALLTDLQQIDEGKQLAAIQNENFSQGYRAIDAGLRILVEGDAGPSKFPDGYSRLITKSNVEPGKLPKTPGTPQDYQSAWGIGG